MERTFLEGLTVGQQALTEEVIHAILAENDRDVQAVRQSAQEWEDKYNQAVHQHQTVLADMEFSAMLRETVSRARGRNQKAIAALLDMDALKGSADPRAAVEQAVAALKKDSAYLFDTGPTPPPYAPGTGTGQFQGTEGPGTLAAALKERFENRNG